MKILVLCRWEITNVLTASTVVPHLHVLAELKCLDKVILVTLEASKSSGYKNTAPYHILNHQKVYWEPIVSFSGPYKLINQIADILLHSARVTKILRENKIDIIVAHGAPAGALANKISVKSKIPFYVSLFEPHADYMLESKVWEKYGLKYRFQKKWEFLQKEHATGVMPVAEYYKDQLIKEGVSSEKVFVVPCSVDVDKFRFDDRIKTTIRLHLNWEYATIGIYVGKYGGLYYEQEAFRIYKHCFEIIPNFRLIILSPQPQEKILKHLEQSTIDKEKVYIASVPHAEVPAYLSSADFGFATYKPGHSKRFLSPVKIGEYWANGLPVLLTEGVGDDSDIIKQEGGGATYNLQEEGSLDKALQQIQEILKDPAHRQEIPKLAQKYRSPERIREAYEHFFGQSGEEQR